MTIKAIHKVCLKYTSKRKIIIIKKKTSTALIYLVLFAWGKTSTLVLSSHLEASLVSFISTLEFDAHYR